MGSTIYSFGPRAKNVPKNRVKTAKLALKKFGLLTVKTAFLQNFFTHNHNQSIPSITNILKYNKQVIICHNYVAMCALEACLSEKVNLKNKMSILYFFPILASKVPILGNNGSFDALS